MSKHLNITVDLENLCTFCGKDTSFGSGLFVNRIPSDADAKLTLYGGRYHITVEGYMCIECQTPCEEE